MTGETNMSAKSFYEQALRNFFKKCHLKVMMAESRSEERAFCSWKSQANYPVWYRSMPEDQNTSWAKVR